MNTLHFLHTAGGGAVREPQGRVEIFRKENTTRSLTEEPDAVFHSYMATCQVEKQPERKEKKLPFQQPVFVCRTSHISGHTSLFHRVRSYVYNRRIVSDIPIKPDIHRRGCQKPQRLPEHRFPSYSNIL